MSKITIRAKELYTENKILKDKVIQIEGKKIVDISKSKAKADFEGIVTPAFIDAHSHIGMFRSGEPGAEAEGNDHIDQIRPATNPINSIYYDDLAFRDAVDFGVLYSCIIPGSGNIFGGRAKIIRNFSKNVDQGYFKDYGFKMALGYNPRSTTNWRGERPNTRMGVYAMLEKHFDSVLSKYKRADVEFRKNEHELKEKLFKKEISKTSYNQQTEFLKEKKELALEEDDKVLMEALSGKKPIKIHVHKEDDVIYLLHLKEKYGLNFSAEHCIDVHSKRIFELLAKNDVPVIYGPIGSFAYKTELKNDCWKNVEYLVKSKAHYGLMTDHPVIHVTNLRDTLKYFLYAGLTASQAISLITKKNAEILNIADELGSVEVGKLASLLVWNTDPLHLSAFPRTVIGEGKVLRK